MWIMKNSTSLRLPRAEFEIFYLSKDNILVHKPLSIKEASVVEEEKYYQKNLCRLFLSNGVIPGFGQAKQE
jgi:hypothetical protein